MKEIYLTKGQIAFIDDDDFERINQYKYQAQWCKSSNAYYAMRSTVKDSGGRKHRIGMHRDVLGLEQGDGMVGDHIDPAQTLNNQKHNLRIATRQENNCNTRIRKTNTTGYKGVSPAKEKGKYRARIHGLGRRIHLGEFSSPEEAYTVYKAASYMYHGDFARVA